LRPGCNSARAFSRSDRWAGLASTTVSCFVPVKEDGIPRYTTRTLISPPLVGGTAAPLGALTPMVASAGVLADEVWLAALRS